MQTCDPPLTTSKHRHPSEWLSLPLIVLFLATTSLCDISIVRALGGALGWFFLAPFLVLQGFIIHYYANTFQTIQKRLTSISSKNAAAQFRAFLLFTVGVSTIALIAAFILAERRR
jgi:hypothetical protein